MAGSIRDDSGGFLIAVPVVRMITRQGADELPPELVAATVRHICAPGAWPFPTAFAMTREFIESAALLCKNARDQYCAKKANDRERIAGKRRANTGAPIAPIVAATKANVVETMPIVAPYGRNRMNGRNEGMNDIPSTSVEGAAATPGSVADAASGLPRAEAAKMFADAHADFAEWLKNTDAAPAVDLESDWQARKERQKAALRERERQEAANAERNEDAMENDEQ